jgi:hypothetical protein
MNYHIKIELDPKTNLARGAEIVELPKLHVHFSHHDYDIVYNQTTHRQDIIRGQHKFFGGMGMGHGHRTWQEALLSSLYDLYQVSNQLYEGDTFEATYLGRTQVYRCVSFHVMMDDTLHVACTNVGHDTVNCLHSDLPIAQWCKVCQKAWAPKEAA